MKFLILKLFLFCYSATLAQQAGGLKTWSSDHRKLSFQYFSPWTLLPSLDTKSKTLAGVIDKSDGASYIIQITGDVSLDKLSNDSYYDYVKEKMLSAHKQNKILLEDNINFHNKRFHRIIFMLHTKWGLLKEISLINRTGIECTSIQISFPANENSVHDLPVKLKQLDKKVNLQP